jgi:ribosome biogenesis GTPase
VKQKGTVIKSTGSWYDVKLEDGQVLSSRIRGKFRLDGKKLTNPVAVGDHVSVQIEKGEEQVGWITDILPRKNYIVRQSPRQKHALHLLASNIDQAVLVTTIIKPELKPGFIDRFLLMTEPFDLPVSIVINKMDLFSEEEQEKFEGLKQIYESIGYDVLGVSALSGQEIDELHQRLKNKLSLISGQSGVGKTSILNAIQPDLGLKTQELSDYSGKGLHTTTFAEMFELKEGGQIIDTPGIKNLSFNHLSVQDVAHNFREFFELSHDCKFSDCTHRNEPGCAVKEALEKGEVFELRYQNYLQILDEIESQNTWERINM